MSVKIVVGVKLNPQTFLREGNLAHTEHDVPKGAKFCPECGKPAMSTGSAYELKGIRSFSMLNLFRLLLEKRISKEFNLRLGRSSTSPDYYYLGWMTGAGCDSDVFFQFKTVNLTKLRKEIVSVVPEDKWVGEGFGLWAFDE